MKPYILKLTDQEKADLQVLAQEMGMSVEEFVNYALAQALEENSTGVFAGEDSE